MTEERQPSDLPAWSMPATEVARLATEVEWPAEVTREWAFEGASGSGVRVCILDSGIERDHPLVGAVEGAVFAQAEEGDVTISEDEDGDVSGHGTACASIIRSLAPEASLHSVRVLGAGLTGSGDAFLGGLRWAVEQRFDVINMSLSTTKRAFAAALHELADEAYFNRTMLVASAHNMPVESYPWRFAAVVSVGSHDGDDPLDYFYNPEPPVEFFARGVDVEGAWLGGGKMRYSGNSFATPHISGILALIRSKHPDLTPFQLKSVLYLTARNVGPA
ncbi:MAG TPA: S8 family serine peptidase [Gaiellaceae bacterium]|jgi:subtilisin family serine protease